MTKKELKKKNSIRTINKNVTKNSRKVIQKKTKTTKKHEEAKKKNSIAGLKHYTKRIYKEKRTINKNVTKNSRKVIQKKTKTTKKNKHEEAKLNEINAKISINLQIKKNKEIEKDAKNALKLQIKGIKRNEKLTRKDAEKALKLQRKENKKDKNNAEKAFKLRMKENKRDNKVNNLIVNDVEILAKKADNREIEIFLNEIVENNIKDISKKLKSIKIDDDKIVDYLNSVCTHSGECLAFGREHVKIKKLFNDFVDFLHLTHVTNHNTYYYRNYTTLRPHVFE